MRRREFIMLVGGAAAALPRPAWAQQPERMHRIAILMPYAESEQEAQDRVATFVEQLRKLGWNEGRNIRIDTRWATAGVETIEHCDTPTQEAE
jgi:putative ABC transport system substrate-binding protein